MPRYVIVLALLLAGAPARAQSIEKTEFTPITTSVAVKPVPSPALMAPLYSSERIRRDHPRAAMWIMAAANGGMVWVVWHNSQVDGLRR